MANNESYLSQSIHDLCSQIYAFELGFNKSDKKFNDQQLKSCYENLSIRVEEIKNKILNSSEVISMPSKDEFNRGIEILNKIKSNAFEKKEQDLQSLSPEEVVDKMIIRAKKSEEDGKNYSPELQEMFTFKKDESEWEEQKVIFLRFENLIRRTPKLIPHWKVAGPLNYGMSPNQMKEAMISKFKEMSLSGKIILQKNVPQIDPDSAFFYPKKSNNLTRIWGAEYLNSVLKKDSKFAAAEQFLIIEDNATDLEIVIFNARDYPCAGSIKNAYVLGKNIEGVSGAQAAAGLQYYGYHDYKDVDNIIIHLNGTHYVVDTELKSFDPPSLKFEKIQIQNYTSNRFALMAKLPLSFKISLTDIGI